MVKRSKVHGYGVFTTSKVRKGGVVGKSHVVCLTLHQAKELDSTAIGAYLWDAGRDRAVLALGDASFVNHSDEPNVEGWIDWEDRTIKLKALYPLEQDVEVFIDYQRDPRED